MLIVRLKESIFFYQEQQAESREARGVGVSSAFSRLLFLMYSSTDNIVNLLLSD